MKNGADLLFANEDLLRTTMGAWFPGERVVFRGKDLFKDLGKLGWMELLLYGITGRRFNQNQIRLFEGIWVISTSYPDPRLWNNRIAALAGTARSTGNLGISAAIAASEANIYGQQPAIKCIDFFYRAKAKLDAGIDLTLLVKNELTTYRNIYGYGRPIVNNDERITPLLNLARNLGFADGYFVNLAFDVNETLKRGRWRLRMNVAALISALIADQNLSTQQHYLLMVLCFTGGIFPSYIDASNKPEGSFLPLRCSRLQYTGVENRPW